MGVPLLPCRTSQPQYPTPIDSSNPNTQGLVCALTPMQGGIYDGVARQFVSKSVQYGSFPTLQATPAGWGLAVGTGCQPAANAYNGGAGYTPVTTVAGFWIKNGSITNANALWLVSNGGGQQSTTNQSTGSGFYWINTAGERQVSAWCGWSQQTLSVTGVQNGFHCAVLVQSNGGIPQFWLDGVLVATGTAETSYYYDASLAPYTYEYSATLSTTGVGNRVLQAKYAGGLSPAAARSVSLNPWQLFKPATNAGRYGLYASVSGSTLSVAAFQPAAIAAAVLVQSAPTTVSGSATVPAASATGNQSASASASTSQTVDTGTASAGQTAAATISGSARPNTASAVIQSSASATISTTAGQASASAVATLVAPGGVVIATLAPSGTASGVAVESAAASIASTQGGSSAAAVATLAAAATVTGQETPATASATALVGTGGVTVAATARPLTGSAVATESAIVSISSQQGPEQAAAVAALSSSAVVNAAGPSPQASATALAVPTGVTIFAQQARPSGQGSAVQSATILVASRAGAMSSAAVMTLSARMAVAASQAPLTASMFANLITSLSPSILLNIPAEPRFLSLSSERRTFTLK